MDDELEKIRQARLEQLKQGGSSPEDEQRQQQEGNARKGILDQILQPEAADRLGRIRLVKQERAAEVENRLITLAQTGQLRQKVSEAQLKELLEAVADTREERIVVRRKGWGDDLDDLLGENV